ncbi:TonB-dependent siderophore receptor [Pedobacter caeni]|uniref:Iron complex outermembrane recepter protein n=1 Tax=Pedobacter caeni TaxID=288992 RepID=A0A1M5BMB0_9SPHI|nr:TonB-dependent siderophore receptor [Pedobacter caeni]SHF43649.1 iron complex outermembrane recepter protein [Pedobacter caeni]
MTLSYIRPVLTLLLLFLFSVSIQAQTKVSGTLMDQKQRPLKNVTLKFKSGKDILHTSSDSSGHFLLVLPKAGNYLVRATAVGFIPFQREYQIPGKPEFLIDTIILSSSNEELQTVEVIGTSKKKYYGDYSFSATKIASLNKDIPQAIASVSKELIADRQAFALADAVKNVPGVTQNSYYNQFAIRGINQNEEGAIINGMRTRQHYFLQPLTNNLERIEVIKGPASASFSSVDPGGTINLVTKKPLSEDRKQISISAGSFSTIRGALDFTGPLNKEKSLLYRLNVGYEDSKSFRDLQFKKAYLISPSFSYIPNEKTSLNVELVLNKNKTRLDRGQTIFGAIAGQTDLQSTPITFSMGASNDKYNTQDVMLMSNLSHAFTKDLVFNITYMKQTWDEDLQEHRTTNAYGVDEAGKAIPTVAGLRAIQRQQSWNTDNISAYFNINAATGPLHHKLVVGYDLINVQRYRGGADNSAGGYRLKNGRDTSKYDPLKKDRYLFQTVDDITRPIPNVAHFNLAKPAYTLRNLSEYIFTQNEIPPAYSVVNGVYLQDQVKYEKLTLLLGLRQEWYEDYSNYQLSNEKRISRHKLLPRLGITYELNSNINLYGTYLQGYQPQGNTSNLVIIPPPAGTNYKPLESDLKEIGAKSEWMNRSLMVNVSIFEINQKNLLMSANDPVDLNLLIERGAQRSRGIELEASGFLLPNWQFNAGYSYVDAIITDDNNPILKGQRVQNTPQHSGSIWTRYDLNDNRTFKGIGIGAGIQYSGNKLPWYTRDFSLPAYTLLDAALYYSPPKSRVQLAMNVNNVLNTTYWVGAQSYLRLFPGTPRNVMFNATYRF